MKSKEQFFIHIIRKHGMRNMMLTMKKSILCFGMMICLAAASGCSSKKESKISEADLESCRKEIEVTDSNWETYFDMIEPTEEEISEASDKNDLYSLSAVISLKDEYRKTLIELDPVTFDVTARAVVESEITSIESGEKIEAVSYESDITNKGCVISSDTFEGNALVKAEKLVEKRSYDGVEADYYNESVYSYNEINITSISGSLEYYEIPDEVWNTDDQNERYVLIGNQDGSERKVYEGTF